MDECKSFMRRTHCIPGSATTVEKILELAIRTGTRLHIHVSETSKEVEDSFTL